MKFNVLHRLVLTFLLLSFISINSQILGNLKVVILRVSFPPNDYPGVSGNGDFLYELNINQCGDYIIDSPPHDKNYFKSHLKAVNNYYKSVSGGKFGLNLNESKVYPADEKSSYKLDQLMNYYNQLGMENDHEKRITELLRDATRKAYEIDKINYNDYDLVIVVHPGVGQDFSLPFLDPTPEDIPSTYIDYDMLNRHLGGSINFENSSITNGIIIPETQNHLFYDFASFNQLSNPCDLQYSITGTLAMMIGFSIGLPPLWDLETGLSGVGVFALMDQGSNNGRGVIPAPPDAWSRIKAGWVTTVIPQSFNKIKLENSLLKPIIKIPINDNEYFLIENRNNWFRKGVNIDSVRYEIWNKSNIYPPFINILLDSVKISKDRYGVITNIPNYNLGLPASGLLIWHIDQNKINEGLNNFSINSDRVFRGIDLEEADGAQDMGFISNLLTDPSSGYWGDMWFAENLEYFRANSTNSMDFSSFTYPNTKSNSGANSGIYLSNISNAGEEMSFNISSSYNVKVIEDSSKSILLQGDIDRDGSLDFIGFGDSLWWSSDLVAFKTFHKSINKSYQACIVQNSNINPNSISVVVVSQNKDFSFFEWFEYSINDNNFNLKWAYKLNNTEKIELLKADIEGIWVKKQTSILIINNKGIIDHSINSNLLTYNSSLSVPVILDNDKIIINKQIVKKGNYKSLSLIDLENDGIVEIIGVNENGIIDAFDFNLYNKNGFPVEANSVGSVFAMDLFNDSKRELVYQNNNGEIIVLNHEGISLDVIATPNKLVSLGTFEGKNGIVTNKAFFSFIDQSTTIVNEWRYPFSTSDNSRYLLLEIPKNNNLEILDKTLSYAYPNPSYGEMVKFRIKLINTDIIKIYIYDIAGFHLETLSIDIGLYNSQTIQNRSSYINNIIEIPWDISNISSGIYLARVEAKFKNQISEKIIKVGIIK